MFNAAFLSGPVAHDAELMQRIMLPKVHFNARGLEWAFWVCEDWIAAGTRRRSRTAFSKHGLRHSVDLPGMAAAELRPPVRRLPPIDVRRAATGPVGAAFCSIGSMCFHVPLTWFREVFDSDSVWERFAAYVGYVDGEPVSTAAVVMGGGAMGVYNVATLPGHQRRGYGEAVMRHAIEDAQREHGAGPVILQSTPAGYRLYERMGFRTVTRVAVYST
jgi:ribosomal protein S18 acetylase RimI-like enzyme